MYSIFVTGATGFIGQKLLAFLNDKVGACKETGTTGIVEGTSIKILSRQLHSCYETVVCDLQSDPIPDSALLGIDTVFHLAGFAHDMREAYDVEHLYREVNVDATVRLAELAVNSNVKRFIYVSSIKAGGIYEDDKGNQPEGVYGETKREAELKILEIGRKSEMNVSIVRPSLVYGPGVKGNLGLMRKGIEQGWFPPLPETGNRRSLIHVDDLVQALLLVAEDERTHGEIFIATDGMTHSSREIYDAICISVGKKVPKWSIPKFVFGWLSLLSYSIRYKVDKLLGDEFYSSDKLARLGFKAEKTFLDFGTD